LLDDAYRQNRMATAAAVRHLHSLHVKAPVFGLVWSDGSVRAHVDWCVSKEDEPPIVRSALFSGAHADDGLGSPAYEWDLRSPANIIQVFLLVKNIDDWTLNGFLECVEAGIADLEESVLIKRYAYQPWKRVGTLKAPRPKESYGAENSSSQPSAAVAVAQNTRSKSRRARHS